MNWISVKDRLPEEDGRYLVYHGSIEVVQFRDDDWLTVWSVTHWMELPEPPDVEAECELCKSSKKTHEHPNEGLWKMGHNLEE